MFIAQLKNKFTRPEEDMEDLLTSNVFGIWRYLPPQLGLQQFLGTARRQDGTAVMNVGDLKEDYLMNSIIVQKAEGVLKPISNEKDLSPLLNTTHKDKEVIPIPHGGEKDTRIIILGQDPTPKNCHSIPNIKVALNLNKKNGQLRKYINKICVGLGIAIKENIYATNLFKNFFLKPPTQIKKNIFQALNGWWLPLLLDEIEEFPNLPVITLGVKKP